MQLGEGQWFCELIIRSANGTLAVQMLAHEAEVFNLSTRDGQID
jgi:hypothetical protein